MLGYGDGFVLIKRRRSRRVRSAVTIVARLRRLWRPLLVGLGCKDGSRGCDGDWQSGGCGKRRDRGDVSDICGEVGARQRSVSHDVRMTS